MHQSDGIEAYVWVMQREEFERYINPKKTLQMGLGAENSHESGVDSAVW